MSYPTCMTDHLMLSALPAKAAEFLANRPLRMLIGSRWTPAASGQTADCRTGRRHPERRPDPPLLRRPLRARPPTRADCRREEIFAPVAYLRRFRTESKAVQLVNRLSYGLAHSVWTRHLDRATGWPKPWWPATVGSRRTFCSRSEPTAGHGSSLAGDQTTRHTLRIEQRSNQRNC